MFNSLRPSPNLSGATCLLTPASQLVRYTTRLMEEADFVVCSGRKFIAGPRGTGFAALSPSFADQLQLADADISGARLNENLQVQILNHRCDCWNDGRETYLEFSDLGIAAARNTRARWCSRV